MSIDEIKKLDTKERIILMNEIWESLETKDTIVDSPKWHKEILQDRVKRINTNEAKYISLEELRTR